MRLITDHKLNGLNEALDVQVIDKPGHGGANHRYAIRPTGQNPINTEDPIGSSQRAGACCDIRFQNGPINEHGVNGISNEALLAVVIDRLRGFQHKRLEPTVADQSPGFDFNSRGDFACKENAVALTHLEEGLMWLQKRTRDRMARGVEGTSQK